MSRSLTPGLFWGRVAAAIGPAVAGLEREGDSWRDAYVKLWNDTRVLEDSLAATQRN